MFLAFFAWASCNTVSAQTNPGYAGKHWILKLDLVTPIAERGVLADLEYVAHRNFSVSLTGFYSDMLYTQRLPGFYASGIDSVPGKANLKDLQFGFGLRYYLNQAMPAPKRNYIFANFSTGVASAQGYHFRKDNNSVSNVLDRYKIENVQSSRFNVGFGYQDIVAKRIAIDFDWGLALGMLAVGDGIVVDNITKPALVKGFSDKYGPNIIGVPNISGVPGGLGLALHLKVGILLF